MESNVKLEEGSYNSEPARKSSNKRIVKKGKAGREKNAQQYMKNMMLPRSQRKSAPIKGTGKHGNRFTKHVSGPYMGEEATINEVKIGDDVTFTHNKKKVTGKVIYRHDGNDAKNAGKAALMGHVNVQVHGDKSYPVTVHVSKLKPALKEERNMENINEQILDLIDNIDSGNHIEANNIFNGLLQKRIDDILDIAKEEVAKTMFNTQECAECEEQNEEVKVGDTVSPNYGPNKGKKTKVTRVHPNKSVDTESGYHSPGAYDQHTNEEVEIEEGMVKAANKAAKKAYVQKLGHKVSSFSTPKAHVQSGRNALKNKPTGYYEETEVTNEALKGNQHKIDANKNGKIDAHDFKMLRGKKKGMKEEAGVEEAVVIKPTPALQSAIDAYKKKKQQSASVTIPKTRETPAVKVGK